MMRIKRKKSIRISLLLLRLLKQLPWPAHTYAYYTYTYVYAKLYVLYALIIEFMPFIFRLIKRDHGPGDPHTHNTHNHHNRGKKAHEAHESSSLSLPEQWDIMKIKVPAPCPCVGVGDRRRSGSGSGMKVMKGLNFYLFYISILPAYLNLRRAKELDEFIAFLYFYLYLKGLSTGDFPGVLMELSSFSIEIEDDPRESEISISYRNLLMILKKSGLSNEPFRVIGVIGDCDLGFRYNLAKESPQTRHQTCWLHSAVNANVLDSMPQSVQTLTLPLTKKIIIIHEIYLSPTKDEALKVLNKFTEIFETKYTESTTPPLATFISPISIYMYPVTDYISQGRNLRNLILTMTYNFGMFKWRVNPMDMTDSAKPLLIVIKSIITNVRKAFPYTALRSDILR
ncbi:MAG: hypothetical protein GTO45_17905 [Candidatus Aminicenantes bacterium]|nr:hypothetical protein [Candidatus Aminicenantes bacterium]NIM80654.1 hypothetical protein [Candidatus Aminicenantes bacterium]NIN20035.1 hypothetical protein [Candidatus Aminicenantes bacterium]NIN43823.1 hypothetical protein [Candidatus Aminicenantes bacterium]NIN86633.1 hypothetical protein [Candidatus Aminicenantes bacterium]